MTRQRFTIVGRISYHSGLPPQPQRFTGKQMNPAEIEALIVAGLPGAKVQVESDDGTHFSAVIITDEFNGKRTLQRHQRVYAALGERMGREIHALTMQTYTPAEWQAHGLQQ